MTKEEKKELDELELKINSWFVRRNENDYERKKLEREKKKLLKALDDLEAKYSRKKNGTEERH